MEREGVPRSHGRCGSTSSARHAGTDRLAPMATTPKGTTDSRDDMALAGTAEERLEEKLEELLEAVEEVAEEAAEEAAEEGDSSGDFPLETDYQLPGIDNRERSLPIRQADLTRMLLAEPELSEDDRVKLSAFGEILGATFHNEFFSKLRQLKELYAPLDPDSDYVDLKDHSRPRTEHADEDFLIPFEAALERANYRPLELDVLHEAISAPNE